MTDKLEDIFHKRNSFMKEIQSKFPNSYPAQWPINISEKSSQTILRETALKGVEEMFEALQHLKNWKTHRETDMPEIDREEFLEEIVDAFNYFMALLIVVDVDEEKLFEAYLKKDKKIRKRLDEGY